MKNRICERKIITEYRTPEKEKSRDFLKNRLQVNHTKKEESYWTNHLQKNYHEEEKANGEWLEGTAETRVDWCEYYKYKNT